MQTFRYSSLDASGRPRNGVLQAVDRADAVRKLSSRGEIPTTLHEDGVKGNGRAAAAAVAAQPRSAPSSVPATGRITFGRRERPTLRRSDIAALIRELATALEAGLPMMQSLRTVRKQAQGPALPVILDYLIERVEGGDPLYAAARDYGPPFDDMIVGMLRAADASGEMSTVLHQLADLLDRQIELRREVAGATVYPGIVATLIVASAIILVTVLVPQLIEPMSRNPDFQMPWPTEVVLAASNIIKAYWWMCLLVVAAAIAGWRAWLSVPANRMRFDRFKLRSPLLGRLLRDVAVARFTRTLGTLTAAGLPILDALRITKQTLGNAALIDAIEQVEEKVTAGKSLAEPLERSGLFPPLLVQVVSLGERSGRLESMLIHAATAFDRQVETAIKMFTKALPPVLLVIMATVGAFVLAAILLPLLEMQANMG